MQKKAEYVPAMKALSSWPMENYWLHVMCHETCAVSTYSHNLPETTQM